jgi:hypothetical protein
LFLIFDDPDRVDIGKYVFNTEGHPFELDRPDFDYSSMQVGALPVPSDSATAY